MHRVGMVTLVLLVSAPAFASPVAIRVQQPQLRRLEREMKGYPIHVQQDRVEQAGVLCFDPVGVNQLDVQTRIDEMTLVPNGGRLDATVVMSEIAIRGEVFATGGFPCFDVSETLDPLLLTDVRITMGLNVRANAGKLVLEVIDTQTTVGSISISGSETLASIEETFGLLEGMLPGLIDTAARMGIDFANTKIETLSSGSAMGIPYQVIFTEASVAADGIDVAGRIEPGLGTRAACLPADAQAPLLTALVATAPPLPATLAPASGVVVSASGDLPGSVLGAAWWAGMFCGEQVLDPPELLKEAVETITGKASGTLTIRYNLAKAPVVTVAGGQVSVDVEGMHLEILDPSGVLFGADFGLHVAGTARIDPDTRLVLAMFEEASLDISRLESSLVSDEAGRAELQRFLTEDLPVQLVEGMRDMPVSDAVFIYPGARVLLELVQADTGFQAALSPFLVPDPEVDEIAPDTIIDPPIDRGWKTTELRLAANDDRPGAIVYSWSVDDGPWSAWSTETDVMLSLAPGDHTFVAMSRDSWGNVDATPATMTITRDESIGSCACSTTTGSPAGGLLPVTLAVLAIVSMRRRRTAAFFAPIAAAVVIAPSLAHADETRVMPKGYFSVSLVAVSVLQNPPSDVTGTSVEVPTGMFPLGIDAKASESHRVKATLLVPTVVIGLAKNVHGVVYLPIFQEAEVEIRKFEVRAAGINVTGQAQDAMREAGFKSPSKNKDADPMSTWRGSGIGDLGAMVRWRAISTKQVAFAFNAGIKIPTGRRDDPRILTDFGFSDGQVDLSLDGSGERRLGQFVVGATAGYRLRLPGEAQTRPVGSPTVTMMRDPGDVMRAGVSSRISGQGLRAFGLEGGVAIEHHERDYNSAHIKMAGSQYGNAVVLSASASVNNAKWFMKHYKRGRIMGLPGGLSLGVQRSFSPDNKNLEVFQGTARVDIYL